MNRLEALEHFSEKIGKKLISEYKFKFEENFKEHQEKVKNLIINGMKKLIKNAKENYKDDGEYKIAVFQFELLRINILNENYKILAHGYNWSWYLDQASIYEEIDFKFLFEPLIELKQRLIKEKKIYMGKVNNYDIQSMIIDLAVECYKNMSIDIRNWLWNIDEENFMEESSIENFYTIKWSEYQGKSETLFAMDNREKDIKELLELKKKPKEKLPFVYTVWKNSILENAEFIKEDMLFINFKQSKIKKIDFTESNIIRAQFKNTEIKECKFNSSNLVGSSFENSLIEDTNFNNAECIGVNFEKSELRYVEFKGTNLKNAVFTNAIFKNVSFEGANLEDAVFSEKDIPFIHLSPEQLQKIYINGGQR